MPKNAGPDVTEEGHVQALFEFGYDARHPRVERGEVFKLGGHANDGTLLTLRYISPMAPGTQIKQCGACGKLFATDEARTAHGDTWHAYTCECGWVAPVGKQAARVKALAEHREKCDVMRASRQDRRQAHLQEVKEIKAPSTVTVG